MHREFLLALLGYVCRVLVSALKKDETTFGTAKHTQIMAAAKSAIGASKDRLHEQELKRITDPILAATESTNLRGQEIGKGLQTPPSYINGTYLSDLEFRDELHRRYCRTPPNLPTHCDDCGAQFSIAHDLECKKGGLVIERHDEIKFELQDFTASALIPSFVRRGEPHIYPGRRADVLKRPKECRPQQKNVVEISVDIKLIAFCTCVLRI